MTLQELLAEFRNQVSDTAQPYLWSDDEVLGYIIDAQDQFVRRTGGIADMSTEAICNVALEADTPFTAHSPYILRIMSGRLLTAQKDVRFLQESDLRLIIDEDTNDYGQNVQYTLDDEDTGVVRYGVLGVEEKKIRWVKVPDSADTCRLRVYRLPYPRITDWDTNELEIDEFHHRHLILWMKHLAYSKQDSEARDDKKAADNQLAFFKYCDDARNEMDRRRYRPRVVRYGGV